jgi:aspartate aminotransferase
MHCCDIDNHHYGSASGLLPLRAAIADRLHESLDSTWDPHDVLVTMGAKQALYLALCAILEPGDSVIVAKPCWPGHRGAVTAAAGAVRYAETTIETGFLVTPDILEAAWDSQTKAVIVASPANPTGGVYSASQWSTIARWARERDVWVITDDVYGALVYDGLHTPLLASAPDMRDRCILVNSVSKAHAMTGWRVGWLAGPVEIIAAATTMLSRTITHVPQVMQAAALEAVRGDPNALAGARTAYRARRNRIHAALTAVEGVECILPRGGMFVFPSVAALLRGSSAGLGSSSELAAWLLDEAHVAVVPGEAFQAPGHLRVNFTVGDHALDEAATRLHTALRSLTSSSELNSRLDARAGWREAVPH